MIVVDTRVPKSCEECPIGWDKCGRDRNPYQKLGQEGCLIKAAFDNYATNGDVIKALFPDVNIMRGVGTNYAGLAVKGKDITVDWIDTPYINDSDKSADTFEKLLNSGFYERFRKEDK